MVYRLLPVAEWERVEPLLEQHGGTLPDARLSLIAVAETPAGDIAGFLVLQYVAHLEPLYVAPEHSGKVFYRSLVNLLRSHLSTGEYFAFAPEGKIGLMAEAVGMQLVPWKVFRGVCPPEVRGE